MMIKRLKVLNLNTCQQNQSLAALKKGVCVYIVELGSWRTPYTMVSKDPKNPICPNQLTRPDLTCDLFDFSGQQQMFAFKTKRGRVSSSKICLNLTQL